MLSESDIRTLRSSDSTWGKTVDWVITILPVGLLVLANINLHLASKMASEAGESLAGVLHVWLRGVDGGVRYSGTFVMALDLFRSALMQLISALVLVVVAYSYGTSRRMTARIAGTLRECGCLPR
jgi:hypothetical protein